MSEGKTALDLHKEYCELTCSTKRDHAIPTDAEDKRLDEIIALLDAIPADVMTRLKTAEDSLERLRDVAQCMTMICELVRDDDLDRLPDVRELAASLIERAVNHRKGVSISDLAREMAEALQLVCDDDDGQISEVTA